MNNTPKLRNTAILLSRRPGRAGMTLYSRYVITEGVSSTFRIKLRGTIADRELLESRML